MSGFSVLTTQASLTVGKLICKLKSKSIPRDLSLARTLAATKLFLLMEISALKSSSDDGCNVEIDDKKFFQIFKIFSPEQIPIFVWPARNLSRPPYKVHQSWLFLCVLILPTENKYPLGKGVNSTQFYVCFSLGHGCIIFPYSWMGHPGKIPYGKIRIFGKCNVNKIGKPTVH